MSFDVSFDYGYYPVDSCGGYACEGFGTTTDYGTTQSDFGYDLSYNYAPAYDNFQYEGVGYEYGYQPEISKENFVKFPEKKSNSSTGLVAGLSTAVLAVGTAICLIKKGKAGQALKSAQKAVSKGTANSGFAQKIKGLFVNASAKKTAQINPISISRNAQIPIVSGAGFPKVVVPKTKSLTYNPSIVKGSEVQAVIKKTTTVPKVVKQTATKTATPAVKPSMIAQPSAKPKTSGVASAKSQKVASTVSASTAEGLSPSTIQAYASNVPKEYRSQLEKLIKHNFENDPSKIFVESANHGYSTFGLDGAVLKEAGIISSDKYLIKTLPDGRKVVSMFVNPGKARRDFCGRHFLQHISVVSDGKEYTPLQKTLIEIISQRKNLTSDFSSIGDILSLGIYNTAGGKIAANKDILLSSIATARKEIGANIDAEFVEKALSLPKDKIMSMKNAIC